MQQAHDGAAPLPLPPLPSARLDAVVGMMMMVMIAQS